MTEADIINGILDREGEAFTDRPSDRGGPTRWGVTLPVLAEFWGRSATVAQLRALPREEAYEVLQHVFVRRSGYERLRDDRVRALMCDWAVNSSVERATRWLQRTLGVAVDGRCGPQTLAAANALDPAALLKRLGLARQVFYVRTALQDDRIQEGVVARTNLAHLEGWLNRNWAVSVDPL